VLRPEKAGDPMLQKRLDLEARAASTLNHPSIAALLDFEANGEAPYLIYEFVNGKTLRAMQDERALPLRDVLSIFASLAEGLAAALDAGIVHRDLKLEKVVMRTEGQVKMLDFGLAKVMQSRTGEDDATQSKWTIQGSVVGSPGYMSPEQIEGDPVDHRTDIFALGIMLYEFAVRQHPFKGKSAHSTLSNILKEEPRDLSSLSGTGVIPRDLTRIIQKCLRKTRDERYQSMRDIAVDLNDVLRELAAPGQSLNALQGRFVVPHAWAKFMLLQCLYVTIYVAALTFITSLDDNDLQDAFPLPPTMSFLLIIFLAMCGLAMRAWTMTAVGYRHPDAGKRFRQVFLLLFLLDAVWAASPLLLMKNMGSFRFLALGCVAIMVYLPFSQRTLMESIYPKQIRTVTE